MTHLTDNQIIHTLFLYFEMKKNYQMFNDPSTSIDDVVKYIQDNWDTTVKE